MNLQPTHWTGIDIRYLWNLLALWVGGLIGFGTVRYAIRNQPVAVCGKGGSYQLDDSFQVGD